MKPFLLILILGIFPSTSIAQPVASVNGETISADQLGWSIQVLTPTQRELFKSHPNPKDYLLNTLIGEELLFQDAEEKGINNQPNFKARLKQARKSLLTTYYLQQFLAPKMTERALKKYYKDNKKLYNTEMANFARIIVPTEKEATELIGKLKSGQKFETLGKTAGRKPASFYDPAMQFSRRQLDRKFAKQLFDAKPDTILRKKKVERGWEIIKINKFESGIQLPYAQAKEMVAFDYQQLLLETEVERLRKDAKVEVFQAAADKVPF